MTLTSATTPAADYKYSFRLSLFSKLASYRLTDHSLVWSEGGRGGELAFSDIRRIRIYASPGARQAPPFRRCVITPRRGRARVLSSSHLDGISFESRMKSYQPFVEELLSRVAAGNPNVEFFHGYSIGLWIAYVVLFAVFVASFLGNGLLAVMSLMDRDAAGSIAFGFLSLIMLGLMAVFWRLVRRNRPRRYDPRTENPLPPLKF